MFSRDERDRPILDAPLTTLIAALAGAAPESLGHVNASQVLVVLGAARRSATASIRPLSYGGPGPSRVSGKFRKPAITIDRVSMRYEICLRPRFFLTLTPAERLRVIVHELWHVTPSFDGTLAPDRRHKNTDPHVDPHGDDAAIDAIIRAYRDADSPGDATLSVDGEVRLRAWTTRPPSRVPRDAPVRDLYDESDLFLAITPMT